jgi:hypothetical protein
MREVVYRIRKAYGSVLWWAVVFVTFDMQKEIYVKFVGMILIFIPNRPV